MNTRAKVLLIGLGALSWKRARPLLESGKLPGLAGRISLARFFPVSFDAPRLRSAWCTTVATGLRTCEHGIWREFSPGSAAINVHFLKPAIWERFQANGWATAVIGWPGQESLGSPGQWNAGSSFLHGQMGENALTTLGEFRVGPDQIHNDVLTSLVPRWREATSEQNPTISRLRISLGELYSTFRTTKAVLAAQKNGENSTPSRNGILVALNSDFLTYIESVFGRFNLPRRPEIDGHDWALFGGLPDRALGLLDLLIGDLIQTAGSDAKALIVFEPVLEEYSWEPEYGVAVVRGVWDCEPLPSTKWSAEDIAKQLCSEVGIPTVASHPIQDSASVLQKRDLQPEELFHGGVAFAAAGRWQDAHALLQKAWIAHPENRYHALELARACHKLGQSEEARQALETALTFTDLPEFAKELAALQTNVEAIGDASEVELRRPRGTEVDRLYMLAGTNEGFASPVTLLALITRGAVPRIIGGVALEEISRGGKGRVRIYLGKRWQRKESIVKLIVDGITAEAQRLNWDCCLCEIFDAPHLTASMSALGYGLVRQDQCWRVPIPNLFERANAVWHLIEQQSKGDFVTLEGEPEDRHWSEALNIARAHRIQSPHMEAHLSDPAKARRVYRRDLCNFVFRGDDLAAVVLTRSISPARVFVELRAVAPKYRKESRRLNAQVILRPLSKALLQNIECLELIARSPEEAETIALARRSGGVRFQYRHIFEWPVTAD